MHDNMPNIAHGEHVADSYTIFFMSKTLHLSQGIRSNFTNQTFDVALLKSPCEMAGDIVLRGHLCIRV